MRSASAQTRRWSPTLPGVETLVKDLHQEQDGAIRIVSDNAQADPEWRDRVVGADAVRIAGRVRWVGSEEDRMRRFVAVLLLVSSAASAADVTILSFRCDKHPWGEARLIGELRNDSKSPLRFPAIVANFRTSSGELIESSTGYTAIRPLMPGQSSGFHVTGPENPLYASCEIAAIRDRSSLTFSVAPEPKPAPVETWRQAPETKYYKCLDAAGTTTIQTRPCE